jgi:hypothetical protein
MQSQSVKHKSLVTPNTQPGIADGGGQDVMTMQPVPNMPQEDETSAVTLWKGSRH